jgi:DNA polymerase I-like protein with 3'-5' exonuclease and polymerase domains
MLFDKIVETNNFMTVKIVNFIHDEYVIETPDSITTEWKDILQKSMEDAGSYWCKTIKLTAEPLITKIWIK